MHYPQFPTTTMDLSTTIQVTSHQAPPENQQSPVTVPQVDPDVIARKKEHNMRLRALSKTFGSIPGVPIFSQWEKRYDCSNAAVHRSVMAGICGNKLGAYSIALSGLYMDDEDRGDIIIYTGAGGREKWTDTFPPKRIRFGLQTKDQSWDDVPNRALMMSYFSGNPIRVIRSWRCRSKYAPFRGYRYDGLYMVVSCWTDTGINRKKICRCRLERLPGQPPIPEQPLTISTSRRRRREPLVLPITFAAPASSNVPNYTNELNQCSPLPEWNGPVELPRPPQEGETVEPQSGEPAVSPVLGFQSPACFIEQHGRG